MLYRVRAERGRTLERGGALMSDILVVSSKIKKFVREKAGFNTSAETLEALSQRVEKICADAIERARADGRKTVKARDVV